jgi:aubergine
VYEFRYLSSRSEAVIISMQRLANNKPNQLTKLSSVQKVWTNTFNLDVNWQQEVFQLSITIKPAYSKDHQHLAAALLKRAAPKIAALLGPSYFVTGDIIYSLKDLQEETQEVFKEGATSLWLKKTGQHFVLKDLIAQESSNQEIVRFLNVVLRTYMEDQGFKTYGKRSSYFNTSQKAQIISGTLSVLEGYNITIDKYLDGTIKLNIDTCFRISSATNIYREYLDFVDYERRDKDAAKAKFISENIVNKCFSIKNDLNTMVKIMGTDSKKSLKSPSPVEGFVSMRQYFEDKYACKLLEADQLILYSERKKLVFEPGNPTKKALLPEKTYYPSELLFALGLKDSQKKDFRLMNELATITKQTPAEKMRSIEKCASQMRSICSGGLGLKLAQNQPATHSSKVISHPDYLVRGNKSHNAKDGIIFFKEKIFSEASLSRWILVYDSDDGYAGEFYNYLEEALLKMGVKVTEPYWYQLAERATFKDFKESVDYAVEEKYTFMFFIASRNSADQHYKKVKKYADIDAQILTQFSRVDPKKFNKNGFFSKLSYQICSKLGYPLWIVQKPAGLKESDPDTMVVGADVYHNKGNESVAAVVATMNGDYSKYCSLSSVQPKRGQEITENMFEMVLECVEQYRAINKKLPKRILFFRDGVGDSMFELVRRFEISKIKEGLLQKHGKDAPKLSVVVVTKRISEKIICDERNPKSGTILSSHIVKNQLEFFMVAQQVTQGTANPTRYQVISNDCGYDQATLEEITFFQTHNYYGWSGAVKVPAVCQYAHKLAYHVGENYRQTNKFMKLNLYYL